MGNSCFFQEQVQAKDEYLQPSSSQSYPLVVVNDDEVSVAVGGVAVEEEEDGKLLNDENLVFQTADEVVSGGHIWKVS